MPSYDYKCPQCNKITEKRHSILYDPTYFCKVCGIKLVKQMSCKGYVVYHGNGFYETDYKKTLTDE